MRADNPIVKWLMGAMLIGGVGGVLAGAWQASLFILMGVLGIIAMRRWRRS